MFSSPSLLSQLYSTLASMAALVMVAVSCVRWIPDHWAHKFKLRYRGLASRFMLPDLTLVIPQFDGLVVNEVYEAAEIYLEGKINPTTRRLRLSKPKREKSMKLQMEKDEVVIDFFDGRVVYNWRMECEKKEVGQHSSRRGDHSLGELEVRYFELSFPFTEKKQVFESYLPHVMKSAKAIMAQKKTLKLFTLNPSGVWGGPSEAWQSVYLEHPSTFDTLALDPELKKTILDDLDGFVNKEKFYKSVGRAWKRGYLLYGPPGTGKSSLIAAMANYLNFDIYDLDLTQLDYNSQLRNLMVGTANRSILVVEDIDCSVNLKRRQSKRKGQVSLSGMLNFIDGLWSSCGDERIIVFTTNHKDKLDPALLRPGRMDMHILLSYCTPAVFKVLAYNYLKIDQHPLFEDIQRLITEVEVTPAEVAENFMKNAQHDVIIRQLYQFLETKKVQGKEANAESVKKTGGQKGKKDKKVKDDEAQAKIAVEAEGENEKENQGKTDNKAQDDEAKAKTAAEAEGQEAGENQDKKDKNKDSSDKRENTGNDDESSSSSDDDSSDSSGSDDDDDSTSSDQDTSDQKNDTGQNDKE